MTHITLVLKDPKEKHRQRTKKLRDIFDIFESSEESSESLSEETSEESSEETNGINM